MQSNTMSFNNQKNNTITIFRLENWTHLIFWFLFLKSPLFNKLLCSAQQQEERVKINSSSNLWIIVYTFLVKDYFYSFNYRNMFTKGTLKCSSTHFRFRWCLLEVHLNWLQINITLQINVFCIPKEKLYFLLSNYLLWSNFIATHFSLENIPTIWI